MLVLGPNIGKTGKVQRRVWKYTTDIQNTVNNSDLYKGHCSHSNLRTKIDVTLTALFA